MKNVVFGNAKFTFIVRAYTKVLFKLTSSHSEMNFMLKNKWINNLLKKPENFKTIQRTIALSNLLRVLCEFLLINGRFIYIYFYLVN